MRITRWVITLSILLSSQLGVLIHSDLAATYVISAIAAALAVLLSYAIGRSLGLEGHWLFAVPLAWIAAGGLNLAELSTPDALASLLTLLFVQQSPAGLWTGWRTIGLVLLASLMITARTDTLLLLIFLLSLERVYEPRHRRVCLVALAVAASTYMVIQKVSGNYGYVAILNFALADGGSHNIVPHLQLNLHGYLLMMLHQSLQVLGEGFEEALLFVAASLLTFVWLSKRRHATGESNTRLLILSCALTLYLVARFILFPSPSARFMTTAYVLVGILFARAIQRVPSGLSGPPAALGC